MYRSLEYIFSVSIAERLYWLKNSESSINAMIWNVNLTIVSFNQFVRYLLQTLLRSVRQQNKAIDAVAVLCVVLWTLYFHYLFFSKEKSQVQIGMTMNYSSDKWLKWSAKNVIKPILNGLAHPPFKCEIGLCTFGRAGFQPKKKTQLNGIHWTLVTFSAQLIDDNLFILTLRIIFVTWSRFTVRDENNAKQR